MSEPKKEKKSKEVPAVPEDSKGKRFQHTIDQLYGLDSEEEKDDKTEEDEGDA